MPQASKTFRIFVSSTFSDMKAERNALQEYVFPRLRELCTQHGTRFQAIDLRWGVSEEASLDQQTMKICLEEIARCQRVTPRPNFIVLLGDRYGWQPLPEEIPAAEFEAILERVSPEERALLCWEEQDAAGRRGWYRRDDNAVPAVYVLQPREGEFEDYATWHTKVERPLLQVLRQAVAGLDLPPEARLRYEASAAHQEIEHGAMQVEDADEHVFGFFRRITNLDEVKDDLPGAAAKDYVDADADGHFDADAYQRLQDLKGQLGGQIGHNIHNYAAQWTGEGITGDHTGRLPEEMAACQAMLAEEYVPQNLCQAVWRALALVILAECEQLEEKGALELEVEAHAEFGQKRARFFVGREAILEEIATYLAGGSQHPLAMWGASGTGKSALMAKAIEGAEKKHGQAEVIYRFIGATPDSSNGRALLESLCREISRRYGVDEGDVPADYRELVVEFPKRLALATTERPLVLFLDAPDQLSDADNARNLAWLPAELPEHVRLAVSTIPGECLTLLERKLPLGNLVELGSMPSAEGAALLDLWLAEAGRMLQPEQRGDVLGKFERCGLPLYLKLAFEEARRWRSYDGLPVGADDQPGLSADVPGVIRDLFWRLSQEANHGQMLVSRSLGYLAAARNGLSEDEMLDVLSRDEDVMADFRRRSPKSPEVGRLPVVVWSRLYADVEPYLTERGADGTSLMAFYHRQLDEVVAEEYLAGEERQAGHRGLAQYFGQRSLHVQRDEQEIPNLRKLSELPYQQTYGGLWDELRDTLTDFDFLEAKCTHGTSTTDSDGSHRFLGVYEIMEDYERALVVWPIDLPDGQAALSAFRVALRLTAHNLVSWPELTFQEVYPRVLAVIRPEGSRRRRLRSQITKSLSDLAMKVSTLVCYTARYVGIRAKVPTPRRPDREKVFCNLVEHTTTSAVRQVDRHQPEGPKTRLRPSPEGEPWLCQLGLSKPTDAMLPCYGHQGAINALAIAPGERLVSVGDDGTLRLWECASGQEIASLRICCHPLVDIQLLGEKDQGVVLCEECGPFLFDLRSNSVTPMKTGIPSSEARSHTTDRFRSCRFNPISNWVVAQGKILWVVDPNGSRPAVPLKTNLQDFSDKWRDNHLPDDFPDKIADKEFGDITCVALHPKKPLALVGYTEGGMLLWNLMLNRVQDYLPLVWPVTEAIFHPDGYRIYMGGVKPSTGFETHIKAFLTEEGRLIYLMESLEGYVPHAISKDGSTLIAGDWESRLQLRRFKDSSSSPEIVSIMGTHPGGIRCAAIEDHGQWAASGAQDGTVLFWSFSNLPKLGIFTRVQSDSPWLTCRLVDNPPRVLRLSRKDMTGDGPHHFLEFLDLPSLELMRRKVLWVGSVHMPTDDFIFSQDGPVAASVTRLERGALDILALWAWRQLMKHFPKPVETFSPSLLVRNLETGREAGELSLGRGARILSASVDPGGRMVAASTEGGLVILKDLRSGEIWRTHVEKPLESIAVGLAAKNGPLVLGVSADRVFLFDATEESFRDIWATPDQARITVCVLFPEGGRTLLGDQSGQLVVLEVPSAKVTCRWKAHHGPIRACAVGAYGCCAVSGGDDHLVRLWDLAQSHELAKAPLDARPVAVSLLEHSGNLAAVDEGGRFYAWQFMPKKPPSREFTWLGIALRGGLS